MKFYNYSIFPDTLSYILNFLLPICYLLGATIVKNALSLVNVNISRRLICLSAAIIHGSIAAFFPRYVQRPSLNPEFYEMFFISVIIFRSIYIMDLYYTKKYLKEIILVTVLSMLIFIIVNVCMLFNFEENRKKWYFLFIYICCMAGIDKVESVMYYKQFDRMRVGIAILEGEFVLGACIIFCVLTFSMTDTSSLIKSFELLTKFALGSLALGLTFGYAVSYVIISRNLSACVTVFLIISVLYLTTSICIMLLHVSGTIAVTIISVIITHKRPNFQTKEDLTVEKMLEFLSSFLEYATYILLMADHVHLLWDNVKHIFVLKQISVFFMGELSRVLLLIVLYPIMSRTGRLKMQDLLVMFWFGKRGLFQVIFVIISLENYSTDKIQWLTIVFLYMIFHHVALNALTFILLKLFKLNVHPEEKIINFSNCVKLIESKKKIFMFRLKMNRYLGDVKWDLIDKLTELSDKHHSDGIDGKAILTDRKSICKDCQKEVLYIPSRKEHQQMIFEAKHIKNKAYKISAIQQYEHGLLTKDVLRRILQDLENSNENPDVDVDINDFISLCKERKLVNKIRDTFILLDQSEVMPHPRKYHRRIIFKIIASGYYDLSLFLVFFVYFVFYYYDASTSGLTSEVDIYSTFYMIIFFVDFFVKTYGFSHIYYVDGLRKYLSFDWNKIELVSLSSNALSMFLKMYILLTNDHSDGVLYCRNILIQISILRIFRLTAIVHKFRLKIIWFCNKIIGRKLSYACSIGLGMLVCYKEVMHMVPTLITNKMVTQYLMQDLERKYEVIYGVLCWVQGEMPYIPVDLKTKAISRVTMYHVKAYIKKIRDTGLIDENVHLYLMETVSINNKTILSLRTLNLNTPSGILAEQVWIDAKSKSDIFANSFVIKWNEGDTVYDKGMVVQGVYVIIEGQLVQNFSMDQNVLSHIRQYGILPVYEYMSNVKFWKSTTSYIFPGHAIGLLSVMTGRPSEAVVYCKTKSRAYFVPKTLIWDLLNKEESGCINGLYNSIWKYISTKLVLNILWKLPQYGHCTDESLHFHLRRGYVPILRDVEFYTKTAEMDDIILLEGVVEEVHQHQTFVAPCCLPRTINKLRLIKTWVQPVIKVISLKEQIIPYKLKTIQLNNYVSAQSFENKNALKR